MAASTAEGGPPARATPAISPGGPSARTSRTTSGRRGSSFAGSGFAAAQRPQRAWAQEEFPRARRKSSYAVAADNGEVDFLSPEAVEKRYSIANLVDFNVSSSRLGRSGEPARGLQRKRLRIYLATSSVGRTLDVMNGLFSVMSVGLAVLKLYYLSGETLLDAIDLVICMFFLFDYSMRLYIADSRFGQVLMPLSVVDLLTILPTFYTWNRSNILVDEFATPAWIFFLQDCMLNKIRILRLLRLRRLLAYMASEQSKEILLTVLGLVVSVLFVASMLDMFENYYRRRMLAPQLEFHEIMYFLVVTLSTVGYGDINMITPAGRMAVAGIICLFLYYIPRSTNRILKNLGSKSIYSTKVYRASSQVSHVLVTGYADTLSARDFLKEIYHADHGTGELAVVFLMPSPPPPDLANLLDQPCYSSTVTYLEGSPLHSKDLARAAAGSASACFILANKFSSRPAKSDAVSILKALSIKRYVLQTSGRDVLVCVQFMRPESKSLFSISRASIPCYLLDQVISINQIKMDIMAKSCMCPGFSALISNLIGSTAGAESADAGAGADAGAVKSIRGSSKRELSVLASTSCPDQDQGYAPAADTWFSEFKRGADFEIYRTKLSPAFEGICFCAVVEAVYRHLGVLIFALDMVAPGQNRPSVVLNPGKFRMPATNEFNVHGFVIARNEVEADLRLPEGAGEVKNALRAELEALRMQFGPAGTASSAKETEEGAAVGDTDAFPGESVACYMSAGASAKVVPWQAEEGTQEHALQRPLQQQPQQEEGKEAAAAAAIAVAAAAAAEETSGKHVFVPRSVAAGAARGASTPKSGPRQGRMTSKKRFGLNHRHRFGQNQRADEGMGLADIQPKSLWSALKSNLHAGDNLAEGGGDDGDDDIRFNLNPHPMQLDHVTIRSSLEHEFPSVRSHIIMAGSLHNSVGFVRTLRAKYNPGVIPVVLISNDKPPASLWQKLAMFPLVFFLQGSPYDQAVLLRAGVDYARQAVVVANQASKNAVGALRDADAILAMRTIQRLCKDIHIIVEVVNSENLPLLSDSLLVPVAKEATEKVRDTQADRKGSSVDVGRVSLTSDLGEIMEVLMSQSVQREANSEIAMMAPLASGSVFTTSTLDVLVCQSFYNPNLLAVLQVLISGNSLTTSDPAQIALEEALGPLQESHLYQIAVPRTFVGRTYGKLFAHLVRKESALPLALYRCVGPGPGPDARDSYYVSTNPPTSTKLVSQDKVFVLSVKPPQPEAHHGDAVAEIQREIHARAARDKAQEEEVES